MDVPCGIRHGKSRLRVGIFQRDVGKWRLRALMRKSESVNPPESRTSKRKTDVVFGD